MYKLLVDDFNDDTFKLFAVHCNLEDYRLAYYLNKNLNLKLKRQPHDLDVNYFKASYALYEWEDQTKQVNWHLLSNICKTEEKAVSSSGTLFFEDRIVMRTFHLIPEYRNVDYLIKISGEADAVNDRIVLSQLQNISQIITSYTLDVSKLKSKENLIF